MDRRFMTVLGVSLVFALVVSSVFYQMTAHSATKKSDPKDEKDLVVAAHPLNVGLLVKAADLKLVKVPPESVPKGAYSKIEEVAERSVISNILQDEPLIEARLSAKGGGFGLVPNIPVGMRAVTVRVNDTASVAGFVQSGMHVDILVTGRAPNDSTTMTKTFLQNILVLVAGTNLQPDAKGQATPVPTVTLQVNPADAETLTLANNGGGQIQLILRNAGDDKVTETKGSSLGELYGGKRATAATTAPSKQWNGDQGAAPAKRPKAEAPAPVVAAVVPAAPPAAPPPPPPPTSAPVVIIRGNTKTLETVPLAVPLAGSGAAKGPNP